MEGGGLLQKRVILKVRVWTQQEAHGPHRSPEKNSSNQ